MNELLGVLKADRNWNDGQANVKSRHSVQRARGRGSRRHLSAQDDFAAVLSPRSGICQRFQLERPHRGGRLFVRALVKEIMRRSFRAAPLPSRAAFYCAAGAFRGVGRCVLDSRILGHVEGSGACGKTAVFSRTLHSADTTSESNSFGEIFPPART